MQAEPDQSTSELLPVGLTGGIGSGKSTVARMLADRGAAVIDADQVAREVVEPGTPALEEIRSRFGPTVVHDGALDREALAAIVFEDDAARTDLEAITHPHIAERILERIDEIARAGEADVLVVDHPLLVETGQHEQFPVVVVVVAPEETRVQRLVEHRGMSSRDVRARIRSQADDERRRAAATHVIDNSGDHDALTAQVERLWNELTDGRADA